MYQVLGSRLRMNDTIALVTTEEYSTCGALSSIHVDSSSVAYGDLSVSPSGESGIVDMKARNGSYIVCWRPHGWAEFSVVPGSALRVVSATAFRPYGGIRGTNLTLTVLICSQHIVCYTLCAKTL